MVKECSFKKRIFPGSHKKMKRSSTQLSTSSSASSMKRSRTSAKSRKGAQRSLVPRPGNFIRYGFPPRLSIKHRYCELIQVTSTIGAIGQYKWRANGMFDPNVTSTGHQPMYFDVLNTIYNHFTVVKSFIRLYIVGGAGATNPTILSLMVDDDATVPADIVANMENSTAVTKTLPYDSNNTIYLSNKWNASTYFGANPLANDNLQGSGAADPLEQSIYTLSVNALSAASQTVNVRVEIDYYAVWDELKTLDSN